MNRARSQASGYAIAMLVACSAPAVVAEETVSFDPQHNPQTQQLADELADRSQHQVCSVEGIRALLHF